MNYRDFDLHLRRSGRRYIAHVTQSDAGEASELFSLPFTKLELENLILKLRPSSGNRSSGVNNETAAKELGGGLFNAVFQGDVAMRLASCIELARQAQTKVRIKLRLSDVPELASLPWEFLYDQSLNRFLALSKETALVRYLDQPRPLAALEITAPLKVLVMISSPQDYEELNVEAEWEKLHQAFTQLPPGLVQVDRLPHASLAELDQQLSRDSYHIFHYIGHGEFDERNDTSYLVLEDSEVLEDEEGKRVEGEKIDVHLQNHPSLRLVILNACEGARAGSHDVYTGIAQGLIRAGIPAVIGMQFEISDKAALAFSSRFYDCIARGKPVDESLDDARRAIHAAQNGGSEWGTPVLYLRAQNGDLFRLTSREQEKREEQRGKFDVDAAQNYANLERSIRVGAAPSTPITNVPKSLPPKPDFIGVVRASQLETLVTELLSANTTAPLIYGTASIGKTNLSLRALHQDEIKRKFGERRYFVRCETATSLESFIAVIADALGIISAPNLEALILQQLSGQKGEQTLLVLDNLETPWNSFDKTRVEEMLARLSQIDGLKLMASIRGRERPLNIRWQTFEPHPLDLEDARRLFLTISSEFEYDANLDVLLREMSYLPGAIRLLASAAQGEPNLKSVLKRWRKERLVYLQRGEGRDADLAASYEISLNSKGIIGAPESLQLLRLMSVLPDGLAEAALDSLMPESGTTAVSVLSKASLIDKDETGRYRLLNPLRQHLLQKYISDLPDLENTLTYYLGLVREWAPKAGTDPLNGSKAIITLAAEIANIEAMFELGQKTISGYDLIDRALDWSWFVYVSKLGSAKPVEIGLQLAKDLGSALGQANCLLRLGDCAKSRFDYPTAETHYKDALKRYQDLGSALGQANCLQRLGEIALEEANPLRALELFEEARKRYDDIKEPLGTANCTMGLGRVATLQGQYEKARSFLEDAKNRYREIGLEESQGECELYIGDLVFVQGAAARTHYENALALLTPLGAYHYIAEAHRRLARVSEGPDRSRHLNEARAIWTKLGAERGVERLNQEFGNE